MILPDEPTERYFTSPFIVLVTVSLVTTYRHNNTHLLVYTFTLIN
jgi:hypothetical protein